MSRPPRPSLEAVQAWQSRQFGMFIHWGLYSLLGGVWNGQPIDGYNEQIQAHARIPRDEYAELAKQFNPVKWDPDEVCRLALAAGMKFIVLTSKHHDGFSLFGTKHSDFNVVDATPFAQDIVAGLAKACARHGLNFGVYFSTIDWHYEGATGIDYHPVAGVRNDNFLPEAHAQLNVNQLRELAGRYGPISEVWFDMGHPTAEQSASFADAVHALQPNCMVSGRVFNYEGDFTVMGDNEIPAYPMDEPWQSPASIFHETWGYRSWQERGDVKEKAREHLHNLLRVVSRGGNYLLNIGPMGDGSIVEFETDVLKEIGKWLSTHEDALTDVQPQPFRDLDFGCAVVLGEELYLFVLRPPANGVLDLPGLASTVISASPFGADDVLLTVTQDANGAHIQTLDVPNQDLVAVYKICVAGPVSVEPPAIVIGSQPIMMEANQADTYYKTNGAGYYDSPKPYKLVWHLEVPNETSFEVTARVGGKDLTIASASNPEVKTEGLTLFTERATKRCWRVTLSVDDFIQEGAALLEATITATCA